jgi:ABC-type nitrate/sulfonate/bicarbonate transport system substrate-binding protein
VTALACGYATEGQGVTPLAAALECGALADQGFQATLVKLGDAHAVAAALVSGEIAVGNLAAPGLVDAVGKGADLVFIAGGVNQQFLVGSPGATLASIVGQPLGASRQADLTDFLVQLTMTEVLAAPSEVRFIGGSQPRLQALLDGTVAATPLSPPVAIEARLAGCPWLYDYSDLGLNFAIGGIAVARSFLDGQPELVKRVLRAYLEGQSLYKRDREFGISVHEKYGESSRQVAEETYDVTRDGFRDTPDPATDGMRKLIAFWQAAGTLPADLTLDRVVDSAPVIAVCGERDLWGSGS